MPRAKRIVPPVAPNRHARRANAKADQQQTTPTSPPAPPKGPRKPGDDERIAERRAKALTLRKNGASYRTIAAQLDVDVRTAWEDVQAELGALVELNKSRAEHYKELELQRLDLMMAGLAVAIRSGDAYAIDVARKVSESRRKLLGLDAPTKIAPTTPDGDKPYDGIDLSKLSDETLAAMERDLDAVGQTK